MDVESIRPRVVEPRLLCAEGSFVDSGQPNVLYAPPPVFVSPPLPTSEPDTSDDDEELTNDAWAMSMGDGLMDGDGDMYFED